MKIALAIPYNPLEEVGGLELGTVRLARALQEMGNKVCVVTKGQTGQYQDIDILGFPSFPAICRFLVSGDADFDVIHWLEIFPDPGEIELQGMVSGILRSLGKTVVLMVATSGNLKTRGLGKVSTPLIQTTMDAYVISNPGQIAEFADAGITDHIYDFGMGIDTRNEFTVVSPEQVKNIRAELNLPQDAVICLYIGRFVERKRPDFLLKAWQSLSDIYDKVCLVVVGSGMGQDDSIEESVRLLVEQSKGVILRDITSMPHLYYQASDIILLPSSREGQPNVLLEAMACGKVVVGSAISGIQEMLVDGETGLSFSPDDREQFELAIRRLVSSPELRRILGLNAREKVAKEKDIHDIARRYVELYTELRKEDPT